MYKFSSVTGHLNQRRGLNWGIRWKWDSRLKLLCLLKQHVTALPVLFNCFDYQWMIPKLLLITIICLHYNTNVNCIFTAALKSQMINK